MFLLNYARASWSTAHAPVAHNPPVLAQKAPSRSAAGCVQLRCFGCIPISSKESGLLLIQTQITSRHCMPLLLGVSKVGDEQISVVEFSIAHPRRPDNETVHEQKLRPRARHTRHEEIPLFSQQCLFRRGLLLLPCLLSFPFFCLLCCSAFGRRYMRCSSSSGGARKTRWEGVQEEERCGETRSV